uniref:Uncharacterized protein n=1 Tax=Anguilla anguilla TaxID=7936 RepID=A0A0E9TXE3_ANGAN
MLSFVSRAIIMWFQTAIDNLFILYFIYYIELSKLF